MHRRNRTPCTFLADKGEKKKVLAQPGREGAGGGGGGGERGQGVGEEGGRRHRATTLAFLLLLPHGKVGVGA